MPHRNMIAADRALTNLSPQERHALLTQLKITGVAVNLHGADDATKSARVVQITADVASDALPNTIIDALQRTQGSTALVELSLLSSGHHDRPSSSRADSRAARIIRTISDALQTPGQPSHARRLALRARAGHWLQRVEDSVRLAMRVNRPSVGICFDLPAWRAVDGRELTNRLQLAGPRLWHVVIAEDPTDLHALGAALDRMGYAGTVGVDVDDAAALRAAVAAWAAVR